MDKNKIKTFVNEHREEIEIATISVAAIVVGGVVGAKASKKVTEASIRKATAEYNKELLINAFKDVDSYSDKILMPGFSIPDLTVGQLGRLGEEYMKHDPSLTADMIVESIGHVVFE